MDLVVGASQSTVKSLVSKLGSLLAQEYALIRGVRGDIQYINDELCSMQAFLTNLGTGDEDHNAQIQDWAKQIRDIAYDIEDCVDDFAHRLPDDPGGGGGCCSSVNVLIYGILTWFPRREIAVKIAELKNRAEHVGTRRTRYGVRDPDPTKIAGRSAGEAAYLAAENQVSGRQLVGVKEPVGMADAISDLERWVKDPNKARRVLSLVGFGGVGKTTIAMALYRKFGGQFEHRAVVTVSQKFDLGAVLQSILSQVMPQVAVKEEQGRRPAKTATLENQLQKELQQHLKGKRYFLLFDDIWSASAWEIIRNCLPADEVGSIIAVTTRFQAVARTCARDKKNDLLHQVDHLPDEERKALFQESVSESKDIKDGREDLMDIPKDILELCNGLPLAIVTLSGLVACKRKEFEELWQEIRKSLPPKSVNCHTPEGVTKILSFCYNDLPGDLKTCSLYLSVFPKASKISRKRLTRRLIAEGFVSEKHGQSIEELAETYFNQLIRRKIVRAVEHSSNGKVKTCQVHDMVLEYIISKSSEENFITVVGGHWLMPTPRNKVRRLSLHNSDVKHVKDTIGKINLSHVRSVTVFGSLNQLSSLSFKFGIVQVLDLQGCKGFKKHHVKAISKMLLVKFLNLRRTDIKELPSKIGRLKHLETLDIRETNVRELPDSIAQLEKISGILGGNKHTRETLKLPKEIGKKPMKSLSILSGIEIVGGPGGMLDLHEYTGLKKLTIYKLNIQENDPSFKTFVSSIEYLGGCSLKTLSIDDEASDLINSLDSLTSPPKYLTGLELHGMLTKFPQWIQKLSDLRKLTLSMTVLRTDTLELLSKLPSLFSLTFSFSAAKEVPYFGDILHKNKSDSEGEIVVPDGGFEGLKLLRFATPVLPLLIFSEKAMPVVERLEMSFKVLEGVFGMDNLVGLQEVHLQVSDKAGKFTRSALARLTKQARKFANAPRVVVDEYYDGLK